VPLLLALALAFGLLLLRGLGLLATDRGNRGLRHLLAGGWGIHWLQTLAEGLRSG
jgi:hypothetical protein